jgi:hypothetical protein
MTDDFSIPEHSPGFFGGFSEWFGGRATTDTKVEIVKGHTCARRGARDETYYASSYCYWMPEIQAGSNKPPGLSWIGGAHPTGKELSRGNVNGNGKCVKFSVCHNNGRDDDGAVDKTPFIEELPLPRGCLKEKEVEGTCVAEYDATETAQDLIIEISRCDKVETRYNDAVAKFDEANRHLRDLPIEINERIPAEMEKAEQRIVSLDGQLENANQVVWSERRDMYHQCEDYVRGYRDGNVIVRPPSVNWFHDLDNRNIETEVILREAGSMHCHQPMVPTQPIRPTAPHRPVDRQEWEEPKMPIVCESWVGKPATDANGVPTGKPQECVQWELDYKRYEEGKAAEDRAWTLYEQQKQQYTQGLERYTQQMEQYADAMERYRAKMAFFSACRRCDMASDQLGQAADNVNRIERLLLEAHKVPGQLQQRLERAQAEYSDWKDKYPALKSQKDQMDAEWLPQKDECYQAKSDYEEGKRNHVQFCAPQKWPESCEKACVELQGDIAYGCAVVEGTKPQERLSSGGLEVNCRPPQPSWILTPHTYGAQTSMANQCTHIMNFQRPWYSQKFLKKGWLFKKGGSWYDGWDKRFFVIEGGDKARSAILRYFAADPFKSFDQWSKVEREDKGVILWDAKSTKAKSGPHYGWEDGSECFKLYHFYRDYRLCVPGDFVDPEDPSKSVAEHRDEWMQLLDEAIKHRDWQ